MNLIILFITTAILTVFFTLLIKKAALALKITDKPESPRKIHTKEIPLLGGGAIFLSFFIVLYFLRGYLIAGNLDPNHWLGFFLGACVLIFGGFLDDKFNLKPGQQIIWPILAIIFVIGGGIGIEKISNPFGGLIYLNQYKIPLLYFYSHTHYFVLFSDLLTIIWLLAMMYTTKLLDGVDGLVTGISSIGAAIIFLFTMTTKYYQPDIGLAALVLSASCFGFLIFNWHPAKIFLGEGGSLFLGYALGILAIISGGKIAIALLVLGIPLLDLVWTIIRRTAQGKNPFKVADRMHLHHRLLDLGLGQKNTALIFYLIAVFFGISGLFLQSKGKILALSILFLLMLLLIIGFNFINKIKKKRND